MFAPTDDLFSTLPCENSARQGPERKRRILHSPLGSVGLHGPVAVTGSRPKTPDQIPRNFLHDAPSVAHRESSSRSPTSTSPFSTSWAFLFFVSHSRRRVPWPSTLFALPVFRRRQRPSFARTFPLNQIAKWSSYRTSNHCRKFMVLAVGRPEIDAATEQVFCIEIDGARQR